MRQKRSYFMTIFSCFLIVTLLSSCVVLVLNAQSLRIIQQQNLASNRTNLDLMSQTLDQELSQMKQKCLQLAKSKDVIAYSGGQTGQKTTWLRNSIKSALKNTPNWDDFFVYFPTDGYVVSGRNSAIPLTEYVQIYYAANDALKVDFAQSLETALGFPSVTVMDPWGAHTKIAVLLRVNTTAEKYCVIGAVLGESYLLELLEEYKAEKSEWSFLLLDTEHHTLLSTDKVETERSVGENWSEDEPFLFTTQTDSYTVLVNRSKTLSLYFGIAVPTSYFWNQTAEMRRFSFIGIAIGVCVEILLAHLLTHQLYRPVARFMKVLTGSKERRRQPMNEWAFMENVLLREKNEKDKLNQEVMLSERNACLLRLFEGNMQKEHIRSRIVETLGMTCRSERFAVGMLQIESLGELDDNTVSFAVFNVFEEIFNRQDSGRLRYASGYCYPFLLNTAADADTAYVVSLCREGKDFLWEKLGIQMTVSCSEMVDSAEQIQCAYTQAHTALQYRYLLGNGSLILYEQIKDRRFSCAKQPKGVLTSELEHFLKQPGEENDGKAFVQQLLRLNGIDRTVSMDTVECFQFDVVNCIVQLGALQRLLPEERERSIHALIEAQTLEEFSSLLGSLLEQMRSGQEDEESKDVFGKCRTFLLENIADGQLSVRSLAEQMQVSESYLSRGYKQKYGVTIARDISECRVQAAKRLLERTELNMNQIAEQTGFSSSNVFIKVFKQHEGITPGQYRDFHR